MDTSAAAAALRQFDVACHADGGNLWQTSLCGPFILVDLRTTTIVANRRDSNGRMQPWHDVFVGKWLDSIGAANTSINWDGTRWATARIPLAADPFDRLKLLLHESFHRIQPALGLVSVDALNPHLDERDGRYWLRLELRALSAAITAANSPDVRRYAQDAVVFRQERYKRFPGADSTERALEIAEGLAEYTGDRLTLMSGTGDIQRIVRAIDSWQTTPTYTRSFAYATGPALGFVLDRLEPRWRSNINTRRTLGGLLLAVVPLPRGSLDSLANAAATRYAGPTIAAEEDARETRRQQQIAQYRNNFLVGPVLTLRQSGLARSFNPNTLASLPGEGTVYPTGGFAAPWGSLTVDSVGVLVANDYSVLRLVAPTDTAARPLRGRGWQLELQPGWLLKPGARPGDLEVVRDSTRT